MNIASIWNITSRLKTLVFILCLLIQSLKVLGMAIDPRLKLNSSTVKSVSDWKSNSTPFYENSDSVENSWDRSQVRKGIWMGARNSFLLKPKRRNIRAIAKATGHLDGMCAQLPPDDGRFRVQPLQCYQCKSSSKDRDPQCDNKLFKYLRHSEKFILRKRCIKNQGDYCMKTVKKKSGQRITERGCFQGPIIAPNGKELNSDEGCFTYPKDGFLTTTCFCNTENCNSAPITGSGQKGSLIYILCFCLALRFYEIV